MSNIIEDERLIKELHFSNTYPITRTGNIHVIKPYHENGEMAPVVWFEIIEGGIITRRVNSKYVQEIVYEDGVK